MKALITIMAVLGMQSAYAGDGFMNKKLHCVGSSRLNNIIVELDYDPQNGYLTLQNKGNKDLDRVAGLGIDAVDEDSASRNGVTFVSGTYCDTRRVNVEAGPYELIVGPSAAILFMKNDAGKIHDFFRLECTR